MENKQSRLDQIGSYTPLAIRLGSVLSWHVNCFIVSVVQGLQSKFQLSWFIATSEALSLLINAGPRRIDRWSDKPPILVFTDGAVEEGANKVTHGALLLDPVNQHSLVFGDHVPQMFVNAWMRFGKRQVIAQTEIFPVLVAKETWANVLAGRSVLWFLDNESAKMALIRIFSPILDSFLLLQTNAKLDLETQSKNWYSRVPSRSNPSDCIST